MINNSPPFKDRNIRIPIIIPIKGRGLLIKGLGYATKVGDKPTSTKQKQGSMGFENFHMPFRHNGPVHSPPEQSALNKIYPLLGPCSAIKG